LIEYLRSTALLDNTIVVFLADHGDFAGDYGLVRKGVGLPQVLIRIPMLWLGGPLRARNRNHQALVSIVDVFPTICEAIGAPLPPGVQGRSLWPLLDGSVTDTVPDEFRSMYVEHGIGGAALAPEPETAPVHSADLIVINGVPRTVFDATVVTSSGVRRAVIRGSWKLVYDVDLPAELYDLSRDPYELDNRAEDPRLASVRAELQEEMLWWMLRLQDTLPVRRFKPAMPLHNWYRSSEAQEIRTEDVYGPSSQPTEMSHFGASAAPSTN
jgi:arylsulfatase A-like enzyme